MKTKLTAQNLMQFYEPVIGHNPIADNIPCTDYIALYVDGAIKIQKLKKYFMSKRKLKTLNIDNETLVICVCFLHNTNSRYAIEPYIKQTAYHFNDNKSIDIKFTDEEKRIITNVALDLIQKAR